MTHVTNKAGSFTDYSSVLNSAHSTVVVKEVAKFSSVQALSIYEATVSSLRPHSAKRTQESIAGLTQVNQRTVTGSVLFFLSFFLRGQQSKVFAIGGKLKGSTLPPMKGKIQIIITTISAYTERTIVFLQSYFLEIRAVSIPSPPPRRLLSNPKDTSR